MIYMFLIRIYMKQCQTYKTTKVKGKKSHTQQKEKRRGKNGEEKEKKRGKKMRGK